MNHNYRSVIASLLFPILVTGTISAQPEFLQCTSLPDSLCVRDEGVRLPANNQLYLGEGHPDATSCSVHVTQKKNVLSTCGGSLQYEVQLFLNDTSSPYILKSLTSITADSNGMAELYFDTEESPDTQISASGIPYTTGCLRYHRIKWIVTDTCGTESVCEQLIDLYDCQAPEASGDPTEIFFITISISGQTHIFARDFIHTVVDDCSTLDYILYSLKPDEYLPDSLLLCDQVPAYGVEIINKIWIADEGRDLNCDGTMEWSERSIYEHQYHVIYKDNFGGCDPGDFAVWGQVTDGHQSAMANVSVSINIPGQFHNPIITTNSGQYYFNADPLADTITIFAERNDNHKNGVSTLDNIKIQRHLLGKELFTSPYQFIAADANNNQNVSAIDLIEIRKLILGVYTEFPSNLSWKFFRKDFMFDDPMNPWPVSDPSTITIINGHVPGNTDFIGIKIGDLNGTAKPDFTDIKPRGALQPFGLLTTELSYKKGEIIQAPIRMSSSQALTGFQFTLNTNGMEILDVLPGRISLAEGDYALFDDKMTVSWFDENNVDITTDEVLFTLVLKAKQSGYLSQSLGINSDITDAEIYLDGDQTFLPVLNVVNSAAGTDLEIMSFAPNPWKDETTVFFYLPESNNVTYNVVDVNGRKIFSDEEYVIEGYHSYELNAEDFSARGMLFLEIVADGNTVVQKMMMME